MNWDYQNISGDFWNDKPHDEQVALLKIHYPIGYMFHHIQPLSNIPKSQEYSHKWMCEVIDYELVGNKNAFMYPDSGWYNLRVRNIGQEFIQMRRNEYETIHVGFFYPEKSFFRNNKIELIIN